MAAIGGVGQTDPRMFQVDPLQIQIAAQAIEFATRAGLGRKVSVVAPDSAMDATILNYPRFHLLADNIGTTIDLIS